MINNESLLRLLFDTVDGAICLYDKDKKAVLFNRRFTEVYWDIFQQIPETGKKLYTLLPKEQLKERDEQFDHVLQNNELTFEVTYFNDNKERHYRTKLSPLLIDGIVAGVAAHATELTELYQSEQKQNKINRELSLLNQINDAIIHIGDANALMDTVCRLLTTDKDHNLAWIAFTPEDINDDVVPAMVSSTAHAFLQEVNINLVDETRNKCPVSNCLLTGEVVTINDLVEGEGRAMQLHIRDKYNIAATISLPLEMQNGRRGVLSISSPQPNTFTDHEEGILKRVAKNLAFALNAIYALEEKKKAHLQLQTTIKELAIYKYALDRSFIVDIADPNGIIREVNDNFCKISKYSRDELIGRDHNVLRGEDTDVTYKKELWATINAGDIWRGDIEYETRDGIRYWLDTTVVPFKDEEDRIWQHVSIRIDATQRKKTKLALARSKANMFAIFDNTAVGYVLVDENINIVSYNNAAAVFSANELHKEASIGEYMPEYFTPGRRAYLEEATLEVLNGKVYVFELSYEQKDGSLHWYNLRLLPVNNTEEKIFGLVVEISNITDRKRSEQEREKITNDLIYRNSALEQFTYIVSHNLRAPVASIIGLTSLLTEMELDEDDKRSVIEGLAASSKKLDDVIIDINEILRIKNKVNDDKELISFTGIVKEVEQYIAQYYKLKPFTIKTDLTAVDNYHSIKTYIYSIFYNLVSNSIKYSRQGVDPVIEVRSSLDQYARTVTLFFKDNGIGINLERNKEQLFGIYKRFHTHVDGKGLGLFMVKTQLEMLGGSIYVISEENVGTEFIIKLPL